LPAIAAGAAQDLEDTQNMTAGQINEEVTLSEDSILLSESCVNWMTTQSLTGENVLVKK